jgi:hypothetical protein
MSLVATLKKGAVAAASSYKLILLIWATTMASAIAVGYPLKSFLNIIFGNSMAMERFTDGFDIGLAGDIGRPLGGLMAAVSAGTMLYSVIGLLIMTFFAGGLFRRFTLSWGGLTVSEFLKASANNFIPFLKIAIIMMLVIGAYTFIIIGVPVLIIMAVSGRFMPEGASLFPFWAVWALGMPVWIFVADASRRWIAATGSRKAFRAIGAGFRALKEKFWLSYGTVLVVVLLNSAFVFVAFWYAVTKTPDRGILIFLFFIFTQLLVILRLFMKAWRYASVCEACNRQ